jgi:hypothetical protein
MIDMKNGERMQMKLVNSRKAQINFSMDLILKILVFLAAFGITVVIFGLYLTKAGGPASNSVLVSISNLLFNWFA